MLTSQKAQDDIFISDENEARYRENISTCDIVQVKILYVCMCCWVEIQRFVPPVFLDQQISCSSLRDLEMNLKLLSLTVCSPAQKLPGSTSPVSFFT